MNPWLNPLRRALDSATRSIDFFFRDDDVGWANDRLRLLLDSFDRFRVPLDLAVIPEALTIQLARELRTLVTPRLSQRGESG